MTTYAVEPAYFWGGPNVQVVQTTVVPTLVLSSRTIEATYAGFYFGDGQVVQTTVVPTLVPLTRVGQNLTPTTVLGGFDLYTGYADAAALAFYTGSVGVSSQILSVFGGTSTIKTTPYSTAINSVFTGYETVGQGGQQISQNVMYSSFSSYLNSSSPEIVYYETPLGVSPVVGAILNQLHWGLDNAVGYGF